MQAKTKKGVVDKWENRDLGASAEHAVSVPQTDEFEAIEALSSIPISIRMPRTLMEDLKTLAKSNGLNYQPYMRMILTQHVNSKKQST